MRKGLYRDDPLSPQERDEYERDLIAFCDRELDLTGDLRGKDVLYAGGTSPLWIEGLAERTGPAGSLTVLDLDCDALFSARDSFAPDDLPLKPRFVAGDVFDPPFERSSFDLVYSSGLFHELDVGDRSAAEALGAMSKVLRPGGRIATSDFVDDVDAAQVEDEAIEAELERLLSGAKPYGIGSPERLVTLHREVLADVRWSLLPPFDIRHLDRLALAEGEPPGLLQASDGDGRRLSDRRDVLLKRIGREGYTRPATLFVEGMVASG